MKQINPNEKGLIDKLKGTIDDLSMKNAWLNQKIEELEHELKKKTHQNYKNR
jgi:hypothetical protein